MSKAKPISLSPLKATTFLFASSCGIKKSKIKVEIQTTPKSNPLTLFLSSSPFLFSLIFSHSLSLSLRKPEKLCSGCRNQILPKRCCYRTSFTSVDFPVCATLTQNP
ncbi:hypothetical protein ACSBR2_005142 [Camellia fascicularis]